MKFKYAVLLLLLFIPIPQILGQDYLINFAGSGASTIVTTVKVENYMQGTNITMSGNEVLHLLNIDSGVGSLYDNQKSQINFSPNPITDYSTMQFDLPEAGEPIINLIDFSGRKLLQVQNLLSKGRHTYRIQGINKGIYAVIINCKDYSGFGRLVSTNSFNGGMKIEYENTTLSNDVFENTTLTQEVNEISKDLNTEIVMDYSKGDRLKMTGSSGNYSTVVTDIPTGSKTITFDFKDSIPETFDKANRPYFSYDGEKNQYLLEPWNYYLPQNVNRKYPLVVYLHGAGGAGNISYLNYIGYDNPDDNTDDKTALDFQKNHPCFVLVPQTSSGWDNNELITQVENIKSKYRINNSSIYLIGYSMGGSGSYSFANAYYDFNSHLFAGIIRLTGESQTTLRNAIAEKTAIWLHIGLTDTELRIQVTRDAYDYLKNYHANGVETTSPVLIPGYTGTTYTLNINNDDRFKRTEYNNVGHEIFRFPFNDPYLIEWLFIHKL